MRNNQDRMGAPTAPIAAEAAPAIVQQGADFSFIAANDIVELPSGGTHYPEGHPLRVNPRVEVKQMTAKEEDILLNQSYIKSGVVIDKLLSALVTTADFPLDDLLIGDKNAIIVQIRRSAYGDDYPAQVLCKSCYKQTEKVFDLAECVYNKPLSITEGTAQTERGTFITTMPQSKVQVEFRLLSSHDEKALAKKEEKYKKHNLDFSSTLEAFRLSMVAVNGQEGLVNKYLENMPVRDSRHFKQIIKDLPPGVEMRGSFECESCGSQSEIELPINFRFLWPDF